MYRAGKYRGMFVTDLDGTLLSDGKTVLHTERQALECLRRNEILTVIATGRSDYSFNKLVNGADMKPEEYLAVDYVIFSTGAGIMSYPDRKIIKTEALEHAQLKKLCRFLDINRLDYMVHKAIPNTRSFLYRCNGEPYPDFQARLKMYRCYGEILTEEALELLGAATEVLCILPSTDHGDTVKLIREEFPYLNVIQATSPLDGKSTWVEIFPASVSKSQAVKWLAETYAIQPRNVCAVGNDYNDEDLLDWAGKSYVVANAPDILKKRFRTVDSNNNGGVSSVAKCCLRSM